MFVRTLAWAGPLPPSLIRKMNAWPHPTPQQLLFPPDPPAGHGSNSGSSEKRGVPCPVSRVQKCIISNIPPAHAKSEPSSCGGGVPLAPQRGSPGPASAPGRLGCLPPPTVALLRKTHTTRGTEASLDAVFWLSLVSRWPMRL